MKNGLPAIETALELRRRGFVPVPLHALGTMISSGMTTRFSKGKEPILGVGWDAKALALSERELDALYRKHPNTGLGILLGPRGGVIDLEGDGPEAEESRAKLFEGEEVDTLGWSSRRGDHHIFAWDDRLAQIGKAKIELPALPGLEVRLGAGTRAAQSACPPTLGEDGAPRRWNGCEVVAALPEAAFRFLADATRPATRSPDDQAKPPGGNGRGTAEAWFRQALARSAHKVATAPIGTRHHALRDVTRTLAGSLHHGYLEESQIIAAMARAALQCGLPDAEARQAILDALENGKATPLAWPEQLRPTNGRHATPGPRPHRPRRHDRSPPSGTQEPAGSASEAERHPSKPNAPAGEPGRSRDSSGGTQATEEVAHIDEAEAHVMHIHFTDSQADSPEGEDETKAHVTQAYQTQGLGYTSGLGFNGASGLGYTSGLGYRGKTPPTADGDGLPSYDDAISRAISGNIPRGGVSPGRCLFDLARDLKGLTPSADEAELKRIVARWVGLCRTAGVEAPGIETSWAKFRKKWQTIHTPSGKHWGAVGKLALTVIEPADLEKELVTTYRVFVALDELGRDEDGVFYASYRDLGRAVGINHVTAMRRVAKLNILGYVERVAAGDTVRRREGKANSYRLNIPPIPGGAPWNGRSANLARPRPSKTLPAPAQGPPVPATIIPTLVSGELPDAEPMPAEADWEVFRL